MNENPADQDRPVPPGLGEPGSRVALDRRTRSFMTLAMVTALERSHELKQHVRGAIDSGLTRAEIREVFLQAAVYCGVPAAIEAFRTASEVFDEPGR